MYKPILFCFTLLLSCQVSAGAPIKILFGSCAKQDKPIPILNAINAEQADLFMFLGDNIYGDTEDMALLAAKYQQLGNNPGFKQLRANTPLIAIWDDHDYGENDAGREYPMKEASRRIMLDFWQEPMDSPRRRQPDGIYTSYTYGQGQQIIRVIMPDLRWNRAALPHVSEDVYESKRKPANMGPYQPNQENSASMLGEHQWQWLEQELKKPAAIRIIASSLQLLPEFTGWEAWANFPADRNRLLRLIRTAKLNGVMIVSGDTHWGELSLVEQDLDYPLWEITSSGLTEKWKAVSPNQHRQGDFTHEVNYGFLEIDWQTDDPVIHFGLRGVNGQQVIGRTIRLSAISPY
ncbi:alkaline phosphatase D family protein [Bowmanella denitrificans]|uniref:alkaline phosphatase D family protein n=1 Tax=Bowmanella denitrificans TaxID=366582 RepID=UPI000C9B5C2E|nr:alkaline phosphatase D family protein [Bowmanella denitrificans]